MKTAILTISTSVARGVAEDESGPALAELAEAAGAEIVARDVVTDDVRAIEEHLRARRRIDDHVRHLRGELGDVVLDHLSNLQAANELLGSWTFGDQSLCERDFISTE